MSQIGTRRIRRAGILGAVALAASALVVSASGASAATLVADNGFRPATDGFAFPNFGDKVAGIENGQFFVTDETAAGIGPTQMTRMFGRKVCTKTSGACRLTAAAKEWAEEVNKASAGGHCYGFAVMASAAKAGTGWTPARFGAPAIPALSIGGNRALQSQLAMGFAHQALDAVVDATGTGPPSAILAETRTALADGKQIVFAIFQRGFTGGHAITPYAVEDRGGNVFDVLVYDNNYPGVERRMTIDIGKEKWSYEASTNPAEESDLYEGDANTKTLQIIDALAGFGSKNAFPTRPSSNDAQRTGASRAGRQLLTWSGDQSDGRHGSLLVRDAAGNRAGCTHDGDRQSCVNGIPGAGVRNVLAAGETPWNDSHHPRYTLVANRTYHVTLSGRGLRGSAREELSMIGDGYHTGVEHVDLAPGERDSVTFAPRGRGVEFRNGRSADDRVRLELSIEHGAVHFDFHVTTAAFPARARIGARVDRRTRTLSIGSSARKPVRVLIGAERVRGSSARKVMPRWITVPPGGRVSVDYGALRGGGVTAVVDPSARVDGDERTIPLRVSRR